jgi:predicted acyltransferase
MIFGLLAGELLRTERSAREKQFILLASAGAALSIGWLLAITGICPMVKRIWTPSFALFSGGVCCATLAAFYTLVDLKRYRAWTFPLVVVGVNSLAMYCMAQMLEELLSRYAHTGQQPFRFLAYPWRDFFEGALEMLGLWLLCLLMYRRKLFLKI